MSSEPAPSRDRAARHLAQLVTRTDGWHTKPDHKRQEYRDQVDHLLRLAGAVWPDDQTAPAPTVDAAAVHGQLAELGARLEQVNTRAGAALVGVRDLLERADRPAPPAPDRRSPGCTVEHLEPLADDTVDRIETTGNAAGGPTD